ncbi:MAG: hypothetical protein ACLQBB_11080 [Solirubrobacteraceae bacterium]
MYGQETHMARTRRTRQIERPRLVAEMNTLARLRGSQEDRPMRCVSSGYLSGGGSCPETIPAGVVEAAWARELDQAAARESRFFNFAWQGTVWLAFGLADGQIRGVYCPTHRAERDARTAGCEAEESAQPARVAAA